LHTVDGVALAADCWASPGASAAVVVVHGFSGHRHERTVAAATRALRDAGYAVVVYDARGHGRSSGCCTLGDDERHDVAAAVDHARTKADRVVVVGASMGAIAALRFAAGRADVDGVVAVSCPARWRLRTCRSALAALLTQTPPGRWFLARHAGVRLQRGWTRPEEPLALAPRIGCPLAVLHGLDDRFVPADEASALYAASVHPHRLDLVVGMGHAFDDRATASVVAAVAWCLDAAG
jgi:pimeloyl-ACP methyl ester carboxylesterase